MNSKVNFKMRKHFFSMVFLLVLTTSIVFAETATITKQTGGLYFTGNSNDPSTLYQDGIDGNPDVGIKLCDAGGQRYVGAFYALNVLGNWKYVLISYDPSTSSALSFTDQDDGSGCYETTPGLLTISPSKLTVTDPDVYMAAFPARVWIGYSSDGANPGTINNFVLGDDNAVLRGSYTVTRSFDQATKKISIGIPTVTFQTTGGSFSKSMADSVFGLSDKKKVVIGVCDDPHGESCSDGDVFSVASFPDFDTGLVSVDDQMTYNKYVVINGIGNPICIGPNLRVAIQSIQPNPVYYSQTLNITFTILNPRDTPYEIYGGNVDVTTDFYVNIKIYNSTNSSQVVFDKDILIGNNLIPDGSVNVNVHWPAYAKSGYYTVLVTVDNSNDIAECNEGDNTDMATFQLKPIVLPQIYIDGNETNVFPYPNVPYKLNFHFKNSDDVILSNASVQIVQINPLSLSAPTQIFDIIVDENNHTQKSALSTKSTVSFVTDFYGNASFTFIPTYNNIYQEEYRYLNYKEIVGNYSIYLTGTAANGERFNFIIDGKLTNNYPFYIQNLSHINLSHKEIYNKDLVTLSFNFVYQVFTNFLESILR